MGHKKRPSRRAAKRTDADFASALAESKEQLDASVDRLFSQDDLPEPRRVDRATDVDRAKLERIARLVREIDAALELPKRRV